MGNTQFPQFTIVDRGESDDHTGSPKLKLDKDIPQDNETIVRQK